MKPTPTLEQAKAMNISVLVKAFRDAASWARGRAPDTVISHYDELLNHWENWEQFISSSSRPGDCANLILENDQLKAQNQVLRAALQKLVSAFDGETECTEILDMINREARAALSLSTP